MVLDAFRARLGSIIGGFDAAQSHRRMRGFRATRAHVNTLIAASGETITDFGAGRFVSDTTVVDVRVADLPAPRPGDVIVIGADSHVIQGEPLRDRERLIWTLDLRPA